MCKLFLYPKYATPFGTNHTDMANAVFFLNSFITNKYLFLKNVSQVDTRLTRSS